MSTAMRKKEEGVYESQPEKKIQIEMSIFVTQIQILQLGGGKYDVFVLCFKSTKSLNSYHDNQKTTSTNITLVYVSKTYSRPYPS